MRNTSHSKTYSDYNAELRNKLDIPKDRYFTDAFDFFVRYYKELNLDELEPEVNYLKDLVQRFLSKNNPITIKVKINSKTNGGANYTISNYAHFYGDILRVGQLLLKEQLLNYKKHIINFTPFAYTDDLQTILEIIPSITDADLDELNALYDDKTNDAGYLLPYSYIYLIKNYKKKGDGIDTPKRILKSIIDDNELSPYDRKSALEALEFFFNSTDLADKGYLKSLYSHYKNATPPLVELSEVANAFLITIYKDRDAVNTVFNELRNRAFKNDHRPNGIVVEDVTPEREELRSLKLAKPLTVLNDLDYYDSFIDLLDFSIQKLTEDYEGYYEYSNYLHRIFISYLEQMNDLQTVQRVETWVSEHKAKPGMNWFGKEIQGLRDRLIQAKGKDSLEDALKFLEEEN